MSDELREKVARVLANAMGEIGDDVWKFYLREADAAIALVSGEQAARIAQLEAALLTGVCMLSEMGLDPREKCQMAYDYMSAALGEERT